MKLCRKGKMTNINDTTKILILCLIMIIAQGNLYWV